MREISYSKKSLLLCYLAVICGIAFNLLCSIVYDVTDSPLFLDTIGTIVISGIAGIFPGILTGVATNIIRIYSYELQPYYAILSAAIAIVSAVFFRKNLQKKAVNVLGLILVLAFIGGVPGTWVTMLLEEEEYFKPLVNKLIEHVQFRGGLNHHFAVYLSNYIFDIADKTISVLAAMLIMRFIPERIKNMLHSSGLRQDYVPAETRKASFSKMRRSLSVSTVVMIAIVTIVSVAAMTWVSYRIYGKNARKQAVADAKHAIDMAKDRTDVDELRDCVNYGKNAAEYYVIEDMLKMVRETNADLVHMYIIVPEEKGFRFMFDLESAESEIFECGEFVPYTDEFLPYKDNFLRYQDVDAIESKTERGWLLSVLQPITNKASGACICYIGADIDIRSLESYRSLFAVRVILITAALLTVVLAASVRITRNRLVLPINSMAYCANEFIADYGNRGVYDEARRINRLKISTGDEIENLYRAFRKMTVDTVAREQNIRKQSETISRMQSGLIVILADMVENRDNDTGNHIKRTASYVRLIMEGLKRKGYYLDQLTDTFISDVIQSAPLHDLGKIGISDTILNKPGKLTPEEFEIMKKHTTIGGDILERAISEIHGESYLREARNLAKYHHEKWIGGGYPEGLSGEDIPLSARIMAIADVFDAVSQKRVYKEAFAFDKSVEIIYRDSGTSFDPKCVEAFMDSLDEIKEVLESDGEEDNMAV